MIDGRETPSSGARALKSNNQRGGWKRGAIVLRVVASVSEDAGLLTKTKANTAE